MNPMQMKWNPNVRNLSIHSAISLTVTALKVTQRDAMSLSEWGEKLGFYEVSAPFNARWPTQPIFRGVVQTTVYTV